MIYHENPEQLHVGILPSHCYFNPFDKVQNPFDCREVSTCFELLNGDWNFNYYESIIDMDDDFDAINASEYTQEELAEKRHNFELEKCESNIICVD